MLWTFVFSGLLVLLLLFVPVVLIIDTAHQQYELRISLLARASLEPDPKKLLKIRLGILFFKTDLDPFRPGKKRRPKKRGSTKKIKTLRWAARLLKSCRLKAFWLDVDTGDWAVNAKLYPIRMLLNQFGFPCRINFEGRNCLKLKIQHRPIYLLKSFIHF